jgi:hypothetical protein
MALLKPAKQTLCVKGKMAYSMSSRSWNTIRLKKEIIDEYPQLRNRRFKAKYRMTFYRDPVELFLAVEKIMDNKAELPILLYFEQEWNETQN